MKTRSIRKSVLTGGASVLCGLGLMSARAVDWPSDYEENLRAHLAATTPSGDQVGESVATAAQFDGASAAASVAVAMDAPGVSNWWTLSGIPLDTSPVGLMLLFR